MDQAVRVPADMFRFTTDERAPLFSAILHAFGEAHELLVTALSLDEVRERLHGAGDFAALADEELAGALGQLRAWRLLDAVQDHAGEPRTAEEYERRSLRYSLTRLGEAALAGVRHALTALTAPSGAPRTAVLDAIADRLHTLAALSEDPASGDRRICTTLRELEGHLDALRSDTRAFHGEVQRLLHASGTDPAAFREGKAATVAYLQEFLSHLDQSADAVAVALARVEERGVDPLHARALAGAELSPLTAGDPAPFWLRERRSRWEVLRAWFLPTDGAPPRVERLREVAQRAIVTLLEAREGIDQARPGSSGAAADFRELARWFALAPSEEDLHRLWATAFGLGPARHAHLVHPDPEVVPASAGWGQAPPVEVSALLRSSGRTERFTRPGRVRDVAALKSARAERARAERAELEAAWDLLRTTAPVRLSHVGRLDHRVFERLLDLLGRALAVRPGSDGVRRAVTADGRVEVLLRAPDGPGRALLRTSHGRLTAPDYVLEIRPAGGAAHHPHENEQQKRMAG
ncbi:TIGR02677 family protein [Streptomyces sp. NPDC101152]|uniref:TIGR02677 family protein n=1 Tax=Streptomyces sp. NPDC101152 TaxID=3366116 RepID=UPI0037F9BD2B